MRNISIPRVEAQKKNPVPAKAVFFEEGRDSFLTHCAVCHGVDGSGKTPVGTNLYPRAPDLRSDPTQGLTDGEIHYIIENGVQLTGMPAWSASGSSDDIWKLVMVVRSLGQLSPTQRTQQASMLASAHYTGSKACEK